MNINTVANDGVCVNCIIITSLLSCSPGEPGKFSVVGGAVTLQCDIDSPGGMAVAWQQFPWGHGISFHHLNVLSITYFNEVTIPVLIVQHNVCLMKMSSAKVTKFRLI